MMEHHKDKIMQPQKPIEVIRGNHFNLREAQEIHSSNNNGIIKQKPENDNPLQLENLNQIRRSRKNDESDEESKEEFKSITPFSHQSSILYDKNEGAIGANMWNGRYQLRQEIGKGQFGKVFLARDMHLPSQEN